jgi:hypothetical protein
MTIRQRLIIPALALTLAACANAESVKNQPKDIGTARTFDAPYDRVARAAFEGLSRLKLSPSAQNETAEGYMIQIARPPHGFSWGEVGRILVERTDAPPTTVRVVYEKRTAFQFAGSESALARNLFAKMDEVLAAPAATP